MGIVRLWDVATERQTGAPMTVGANSVVRALVFSPDGKTLATMSGASISTTTSSVVLWHVATHRRTGVLVGGSRSIISGSSDEAALSPDWKTLATAHDNAVHLWSLPTGRQISKFSIGGFPVEVQDMEFSPDGKLLATTSSAGRTQLWSVRTGEREGRAVGKQIMMPFGNVSLFTGQNPGGNAAFSPNGKLLATASGDGARFWTVPAARQMGKALPPPNGLREYVSFSPDGKLLAVVDGDGTVTLWNVATHQQVGMPLSAINSPVDAIAFSPQGNFLATANGDGTTRLWNLAIWRQVGDPLYPATRVTNFVSAFALSDRMLAAGASNGTLRLWSVKGRHLIAALALIRTFRYDSAQAVVFSTDGRILATATDLVVQLWDMETHSQIGTPIRVGNSTDITALALSPNGKVLAIACSNTATLWSLATHRQLGTALTIGDGLPSGINALSFGPDGKTLATTSNDEAAIWDVATHRRLVLFRIGPPQTNTGAAFKNVSKAAFSSGGRTLAAAAGGGVRLWDMATHHEIGSVLSPGVATPFVNALAFAPNGKTLAIGSGASVTLWDIATREQIGTPMTVGTSKGGPYLLTFSADGNMLAAASSGLDGTAAVSLFDVSLPASPIKAACSIAHGSLSRQEWERYAPSEPPLQVCP
jgi:WD40 repeat protein